MSDLINREEATLAAIDWVIDRLEGKGNAKTMAQRLKDLPSAQERKKGKWYEDEEVGLCRCDQCHGVNLIHTPFCPNCGADMRGEEDG